MLRHAFVVVALFATLAASMVGCGGSAPAPKGPEKASPAGSTGATGDDHSGFAGTEVTYYRSDRLGLYVPLPDRSAWTIIDRDDTSSSWMVATHAATATTLRARRFEETGLVGRRECEERAVLTGELPSLIERENKGFQPLTDEVVHLPKGWDGWRWVAFEPVAGGTLAGHAYLVSGHQHACLIVHVRTEVRSDTEANVLADRLELFAQRILVGVGVDHAAEPDKLKPAFPKLPPLPGS